MRYTRSVYWIFDIFNFPSLFKKIADLRCHQQTFLNGLYRSVTDAVVLGVTKIKTKPVIRYGLRSCLLVLNRELLRVPTGLPNSSLRTTVFQRNYAEYQGRRYRRVSKILYTHNRSGFISSVERSQSMLFKTSVAIWSDCTFVLCS